MTSKSPGKLEKILIAGGTGLLGINWAQWTKAKYSVTLIGNNYQTNLSQVDLVRRDLRCRGALEEVINKVQPDILVNCVGKTNVEGCEKQKTEAERVNVTLAREIASTCARLSIPMVHISTDMLTDGKSPCATESSPVSPLNIYAETKARAEALISEVNSQCLILRTNFYCWGPTHRPSFSDFILDGLRRRKTLYLFDDVFFTPIYSGQLIEVAHKLLRRNSSGLFNVCGTERITKYQFGLRLARAFELDAEFLKKGFLQNRSDLVARPLDMSLSNAKIVETLGYTVGDLESGLSMLKNDESKLSVS